MEDDIRRRIELVLSVKNVKYTTITGNGARQTKFNRQIKNGSPVTYDIIMLILDYFPDLSAEWLMRGRGDMLSSGTTYNVDLSSSHNTGQQTIGNNNTISSKSNTTSDKDLIAMLKEQQKQMGDLINLMKRENG